MKRPVPIGMSYVLPSWIVGVGITTVLLAILAAGVTTEALIVILRPGLRMAQLMGYGLNDLRGYILMVFVYSIFFGAIVFVLMLAVRNR